MAKFRNLHHINDHYFGHHLSQQTLPFIAFLPKCLIKTSLVISYLLGILLHKNIIMLYLRVMLQ